MECTTGEGVAYEDGADKLTITIGGKAWANLKKIADTMNKIEWCEHDNTPGSVLRFYCGQLIEAAGAAPVTAWDNGLRYADGGVADIMNDLADNLDYGDEDADKEKRRSAELRKALYDALRVA